MGNQSNVPQNRRYQQNPIICCGDQPRHQPMDEASPNVMNVQKNTYGRFSKAYTGSQKHEDHVNFQDTGSTYYKQKDVSIFRRPGNELENSNYQNQRNNNIDHDNVSKDSRDINPLRPITQQQSQLKKQGFASFKKSSYGAYNSNNGYNTFNSYGMHTAKDTKENFKFNLDSKNHKPTPMMDFVGEKQIRHEINKQKAKHQSPFVGDGKYGGRIEQFENNKRIIMFLQQNYVKEPQFKFYDTRDNSSLLNNSTIKMAKKKTGIEDRYIDQNSTSNLRVNQNLSKLQDPIQLSFQIDARIILASCLLIIAIVILILGASVFYSQVGFFICLIIAIILYVCYLLTCYIYSDIIEYFYNTRSFDQFQQDYKTLRSTNGQIAYHVQLQTPQTVIKECYLLSSQNKYTRIQAVQNQNKDISINQLKDKQTSCVFIRYKTKTSFFDAESQLNTINYFEDFLEDQKNIVQSHHGGKQQPKKTKKHSAKGEKQKQNTNYDKRQKDFKKDLKKSDFGYQLDKIQGFSRKPEQVYNVCYMESQDGGCMIAMFIIFTLFGLCLPFLCFFQAYTKRYRINLLNRFKIGQGGLQGR